MKTIEDNTRFLFIDEEPLEIEQRCLTVSSNTQGEVERTLEVIRKEWKFERPSLVVSMTDEADHFMRDNDRRLKLKHGLREVFLTEGVWVITGGTKTGIVQLCEEALKEASLLKQIQDSGTLDIYNKKKKTVLIRIAAASGVRKEPLAGPLVECQDKLILVESESDEPNSELEFRASLERAVCNKNYWEFHRNIPVFCLVIEGELRTLKTVQAQIEVKTPCAVLRGSGKAANLLSDLLEDPNLAKELNCSQDALPSKWFWVKNERRQIVEALGKILPHKKYLKAFHVDEYLIDDRGNLDAAVLETIAGFDADTNQLLDLAEEWYQPGFVERTLSAENIDEIHIKDRLQKAIVNQKPEFVKIYDQWKDVESSLDQADMAEIISDDDEAMLGKYMTLPSKYENQQLLSFESRELAKLFVTSAMNVKPQLTEFYWRKLDNKLAASLVALQVLKDKRGQISIKTDYEIQNRLATMIEEYAKKSVGILNACFTGSIAQSEKITYDILRLRHQIWKNQSCLDLAEAAPFKGFFTEPACYLLVEKIWKDGGDDLAEGEEIVLSNCRAKIYKRFSISGAQRKFYLHHCCQLLFLLLFSWLLLDGTPPVVTFDKSDLFKTSINYLLTAASVSELLLGLTWLFVLEKPKKYAEIRTGWNRIEWFAHTSYLLGLILQHATRNGGLFCYLISLTLHFLRFSRCFRRFQLLGPLMFMIYAMTSDLAVFFSILLLFVLPYGIAIQALLYPSEFSPLSHLVWGVFFRPLFETLGDSDKHELGAVHFENPGNCTKGTGAPWPHNSCPDASYEKTIFAVVLRLIYTMFTNVLLLNLLIALFNNRYEKMNKWSMKFWRFFAYIVCRQYSERSRLSSPIDFIQWLLRFLSHYKKIEHESIWYEDRENRIAPAKMWEKLGSEKYLLRGK